jgi:hypothetical protein
MYLADCGNGVAVAGGVVTASDVGVASVVFPLEHADKVPRAMSALTATSRMRRCFFM